MTRLLLLRHAESEWNAQGRWQGLADPPLSPRGAGQAARAGVLLRPLGISALVSSDLQRARATAERIAAEIGLSGAVAIDSGFQEYDVGAWSGLTPPEIEGEWPGAIDDWRQGRIHQTPGGEMGDHFVARISAALARVAAAHPAETALVVTHGGVLRAICRLVGAPSRRFAHLAGMWVDARPDGLRGGAAVYLLPDPVDEPQELTRS